MIAGPGTDPGLRLPDVDIEAGSLAGLLLFETEIKRCPYASVRHSAGPVSNRLKLSYV